jgi:DNA-binding NtrC family response regulator
MHTILVIDDEEAIRSLCRDRFLSRGWSFWEAGTAAEGRALAEKLSPDIILLDMRLPDQDGIDLLRELRERGCTASILVMTGCGSIANAVEAVKLGAEQYLPKPVDFAELESLLQRIMETRKLRIENVFYQQRLDHPVVGVSLEVQKLHHLIDLMAENADTTTLLLGESGTGKELVAREIHRRSARRDRPFLDINCAVLSETLLESQVFGHEKGAFTDAIEMKRGLLEVADGGTILLDEIGEMPLAVQPKLLRMLESRTFRRVGGTRDLAVNVRVIAATNRDLRKAVAEGRFREDLYYRLHVFPIALPPLRNRQEDVPVLAAHFLGYFNMMLKKNVAGFTARAMELMTAYGWPGNVRELKNVIERALVLSRSAMIDPGLLPREIAGPGSDMPADPERPRRSARTLREMEREHIMKVLQEEGNNRSNTARVLGISRSTLQDKLRRYGLY